MADGEFHSAIFLARQPHKLKLQSDSKKGHNEPEMDVTDVTADPTEAVSRSIAPLQIRAVSPQG